MGLGDELMVAGEARINRDLTGLKTRVFSKKNRVRWQEVWELCPDMFKPGRDHGECHLSRNAPGARPYIDYSRSKPQRWYWKPYKPTPARLELPGEVVPHDSIVIEPNLKYGAPAAKQWGRWQEMVDRYELPWVQVGPRGTRVLRGVRFVETTTLAESLRFLAGARAVVTPEGGLHHAAAALGVPAVVLFGAYIRPDVTGYPEQASLWVDWPEASGWRVPHRLNLIAWKEITISDVMERLEEKLGERVPRNIPPRHRRASV